jgi:hypothetical protein
MKNELAKRLNKYVQEIEYVNRPDNPGKIYFLKDIFKDHNIEDLCFILTYLIDDSDNDETLMRLKDDFISHLESIINCISLFNLPIAIEGLAQKFESFLKKIGYIRYKGTDFWHGNEISEGLTGTTLKLLCEGKISNKFGKDHIDPLVLDFPLFSYSGLSRSLIDFMRINLRNAVHYAPTINRKLILPYSELVIINYLLVIKDNVNILGPRYLSRLAHNQEIINSHIKIEEIYVKNKFLEDPSEDRLRFEPRLTESHLSSVDIKVQKREGTITEIFNSVDRFIIKGIGGLGKTTTLRFFSNNLVKEKNITPLFFSLKDYKRGVSLIEQILIDTEIHVNEFELDLTRGNKYIFLLDGINEIIDLNKRNELLIEIKFLLKKYKDCSAVLSSRKIPEILQLGIPIFNIQPFDQNGIIEYIHKNFPELSEKFIINLKESKRLYRLCSNPLLLQILCNIYQNEDLNKIHNEALIVKAFVSKTIERERIKNPNIDVVKIAHYLMDLGYHTRKNASVSFSHNDVIKILNNSIKNISISDDISSIISFFKDANFIIESNNSLSFQHELYQEYFAAEGLLYYDINIQEFENISHWRSPIMIYSGLSNNRYEIIDSIASNNTLLAAECIEKSIIEENEIENKIVEKSVNSMVKSQEYVQYNRAVLALLKLRKYDELKNHLPTKSKDLGDLVKSREDLDGLSIIQTIIKELDNTHLLEFIQLLLNKDISYRNDIIRGLLDRDIEEMRPIINDIKSILSINIPQLNLKNLLNFASLIGRENLDLPVLVEIRNKIYSHLFNIKSASDLIFITAKEFELFDNIEYLCHVIENIPQGLEGIQNALPIIVDNVYLNYSDKNKILNASSKSKNLLIYLSGYVYATWNVNKIANNFFKSYENIDKLYIPKNIKYNKLINILELEILKNYGPHHQLKNLIRKSFYFEMKYENTKEIILVTEINNIKLKAKWRDRYAIQFLKNKNFVHGKKIYLQIENVDYKHGYLIVVQNNVEQKYSKSKSNIDKVYTNHTKETYLGTKLKEALQGKISNLN